MSPVEGKGKQRDTTLAIEAITLTELEDDGDARDTEACVDERGALTIRVSEKGSEHDEEDSQVKDANVFFAQELMACLRSAIVRA